MTNKTEQLILFILLLVGRKMESIQIIAVLHRFEISLSYECGYPVISTIFYCTCDCDADDAIQNHHDDPRYKDSTSSCTRNQLCFEVGNNITIHQECEAYGVCSLRFLPMNIYKYMNLVNPKTFLNIRLNEDTEDINILLPTNYKMLVYKKVKYKVDCLDEPDDLLPNQNGWYFVRADQNQTITKTNSIQKYNNVEDEIDIGKYCWYQLGNEEAIKNAINNSNAIISEVCQHKFYLPKFDSVKGLYNTTFDEFLPGDEIEVDDIKLFKETVELSYSCKNAHNESDGDFVQMFYSVELKDKNIYLQRYSQFGKIEGDLSSVVVLDEKGHEITEEKNLIAQKQTVLQLRDEFHNFSGSTVLVCIDIKVSISRNWCEHYRLDNSNKYGQVINSDYITVLSIVIPLIFVTIVIILCICCYCNCKNRSKLKKYANVSTREYEEKILMASCRTDRSTNFNKEVSSRYADTKDSEDTRTSDNDIEKAYKEKLINLPPTTVINFNSPIRHFQLGNGCTAVNTEHVDKVPITTTVDKRPAS